MFDNRYSIIDIRFDCFENAVGYWLLAISL